MQLVVNLFGAPPLRSGVDLLNYEPIYQSGFQSKIDGSEVGDKLEIGNFGFTLNYQISDNIILRTCFSSNVFGDKDLETSVLRLQFVFAWNPATERMKKLSQRH